MFSEIFSSFSDSTIYFIMGVSGTVIFLIKITLMLLLGMDHGGDFDVAHGDTGTHAHGSGFSFFSLISIISFMMGAGWLGLAARIEWGWGSFPAAAIASAFGFTLMTFSSLVLWQMKKMNQQGRYDVQKTIGHTGRVYIKIPSRGAGTGQVEMNVDGRRSILIAKSNAGEIDSFTTVKVLEVQDGNIILVEPV